MLQAAFHFKVPNVLLFFFIPIVKGPNSYPGGRRRANSGALLPSSFPPGSRRHARTRGETVSAGLQGRRGVIAALTFAGETLDSHLTLLLNDSQVNGLPNPELMWLVNGRPIYPDLYHRMLVRENGVHSLVIDPVTQKDAGAYTCIACNKAGQSSFTLELKVVGKDRVKINLGEKTIKGRISLKIEVLLTEWCEIRWFGQTAQAVPCD